MPFALNALRDTIAAVLTAHGWVQATWTDAPEESATSDDTFAFHDPTRSSPKAFSSTGGVYAYRWEVRFTWHCDPSSETSPTDGVQAAMAALDAVNYTANWPTGVVEVAIGQPLVTTRKGQPDAQSRVVVITCPITVAVAEAAP